VKLIEASTRHETFGRATNRHGKAAIVDDGADLLAGSVVDIGGGDHDDVRALTESDGKADHDGPRRAALGLSVDLLAVERRIDRRHAAVGRHDRGCHQHRVAHSRLVRRVAEFNGERRGLLRPGGRRGGRDALELEPPVLRFEREAEHAAKSRVLMKRERDPRG